MAPKRKKAAVQLDDDSGSDYHEEDTPSEEPSSDSDYEDEKPKRGRKPSAKATPKRRATKGGEDDAAWVPGSSKKSVSKKSATHPTEIVHLEDGWTLHPPSLIYKLDPTAQGGSKIAAFDLDGTLVGTKSGLDFGRGPEDWKWFNKNVPTVLQELLDDDYQLVIFSNQGAIKSALGGKQSSNVQERITNILVALEAKIKQPVPIQVFIATQHDKNRKPGTGMWKFFVQNANDGVQPDLKKSFYVGDAAGRPTDINTGSSSDKDFAAAIGIPFFLPQDKFGPGDLKTSFGGESAGQNTELATAFLQLADLCKAEPFKANAYKKVAGVIDAFPEVITSAKQVAGVKGVGKSSIAKITEFLETGTIAALEENGITAGVQPVDEAAEVGLRFL